jgi:hypothetical protein
LASFQRRCFHFANVLGTSGFLEERGSGSGFGSISSGTSGKGRNSCDSGHPFYEGSISGRAISAAVSGDQAVGDGARRVGLLRIP